MQLTLKNDASMLPNGTSKTNLYVSQFPRDWTSANLESIFSKYGQIDKIRILTPPNALNLLFLIKMISSVIIWQTLNISNDSLLQQPF